MSIAYYRVIVDRKDKEMTITYQVNVIEKETKQVVETIIVNENEAMAIFAGYANDPFYSVEAIYIK